MRASPDPRPSSPDNRYIAGIRPTAIVSASKRGTALPMQVQSLVVPKHSNLPAMEAFRILTIMSSAPMFLTLSPHAYVTTRRSVTTIEPILSCQSCLRIMYTFPSCSIARSHHPCIRHAGLAHTFFSFHAASGPRPLNLTAMLQNPRRSTKGIVVLN